MTSEEIEVASKTYYAAFRKYTDDQIKEASSKYIEEGEYFPPKPDQIIQLIANHEQEKHDAFLVQRYMCRRCGQKVSAITEGQCLDCAGIPKVTYDNIKPSSEASRPNYKIEGRIMCQECGHIGQAIKEPTDTGIWKCRNCYSGLTEAQRAYEYEKLRGSYGKEI